MVGADGARVDGFRLWLYPSYGGWVRVGGGVCVAMWKRIAVYGLLLGLGTLVLQWLDYQRMARLRMGDVYDFLLGAGFLALGLWIGARVLGRRGAAPAFDGNPRALAELGISPREMAVLREVAAGHSRSEEHTSELQSLMRNSYADFCWEKKK